MYRSTLLIAILLVGAVRPLLAQEARKVDFRASDGVRIFADYHAPKEDKTPAPMVILLHMYKSDRSAWKPLIEPLHNAGFATLAIDMRGHGESATPLLEERATARDPHLFKNMFEDVRAAYDWLAEQDGVDRSRFAIVGASVGCSVALRYAVQDKSVDAIVCLTPGMNYLKLDSARDMRRIQGRQILLTATEDERKACDALAALADGTRVKIHEGEAHGTHMFGVVPDIEKDIAAFLKRGVGKAVDDPCFGSVASEIYHLPGSHWRSRIKPTNLRYYSSEEEAESRGLRAAKTRRSRTPGENPPEPIP
jgi:pimeloyl-ACP methyl ester carboxylesterase